ncbi:hypothetical protein FZEAL_5985 [Fusarium zealandicum]|uniref:Uncharacterized protein n=1 Tax=Fusarium zealandicum TaxID=1053134 RepID=A0A8H4UJF1_9HYPO|nr:hypothetical protein FZEAL_5985 [Fusarium zealandicum]
MVVPAGNFLESLGHLFDEAESKGRDGKIEFTHLRGTLIEFVAACSRMTAAKARASCNLKFIDGSEPKTFLALPPGKIRLDEDTRADLQTSSTGSEFIEVLRHLIKKQVSPRRSPRRSKSTTPSRNSPKSPKSQVQRRAEAAAENSKMKQLVRIKIRRSQEQLGTDEGQQQSSTTHTETKGKAASESLPEVTQQPTPRALSEPPGITASAAESMSDLSDLMDLDLEPDSIGDEGVDDSTLCGSSDSQGDAQMEDVRVTEGTPESSMAQSKLDTIVQRRPGLHDIASEVNTLDASNAEEIKQRLLHLIGRMDAPHAPEETKAALKRLNSGFSKIEPEKAFIPPQTWKTYERKLIKAAKDGWFEKPWSERHYKIGRICYLKEEEAVMESRDWNRLRAAARMWTILAEMTAPPQEPVRQEPVNEWLVAKLGDISFFERLFACKERIAAIRGPGEK